MMIGIALKTFTAIPLTEAVDGSNALDVSASKLQEPQQPAKQSESESKRSTQDFTTPEYA